MIWHKYEKPSSGDNKTPNTIYHVNDIKPPSVSIAENSNLHFSPDKICPIH